MCAPISNSCAVVAAGTFQKNLSIMEVNK